MARMEKVRQLANFIWSVADLLRSDYKQADYGSVAANLKNFINGFSVSGREIIEYCDRMHASYQSLIQKTSEQILKLQGYQRSRITAAVTGKLDISEVDSNV